MRKTDTETLVKAMRILARDIHCEDGVATAAIAEAADRIEELETAIRRLADQDATLSVCNGAVTVTMDATLTDAEREALDAAQNHIDGYDGEWGDKIAATLRGLLERTK